MTTSRPSIFLDSLVHRVLGDRSDLLTGIEDESNLISSVPIVGARSLELADEDEIVFCKSETPESVAALLSSSSRFAVVRPKMLELVNEAYRSEHALVITPRPRLVLALLMSVFQAVQHTDQTEMVHPDAQVAASVTLSPGVVVGPDVEIGPRCIIGANTVVEHAIVGSDCRIGPNCTIGGEGFSFEIDRAGVPVYFPHFGRVIIGDNVEICSNCGISRGSLRDTVLEDHVKLDNLVQVARNCRIGRATFLTANAMLAGSVTVGEQVWIGPSTAVINGAEIGSHAMTALGAVVTSSVDDNAVVAGVPAKKLRDRYSPDDPALG